VRGTPLLVLICGLIAVGYGVLMLALAHREEGVVPFAVVIMAFGLLLSGVAVYGRHHHYTPPDPAAPAKPPARWPIYVVSAIIFLQFLWFYYWMANRR
jgi:hypothetical protein